MKSNHTCLLAAGLLLAGAVVASAQSPAGKELLLNAGALKGLQFPSDVSCEHSSGTCVVAWDFGVFSEDDPPRYQGTRLAATTLSASGGVLRERVLAEEPSDTGATIAMGSHGFALFWINTVGESPNETTVPGYQWFDLDLKKQGDFIFTPPLPGRIGGVRATSSIPGGFVQLVSAYDLPPGQTSEGVFLRFPDFAGRELRPPIMGNPGAAGEQRAWIGGLAVDLSAGIITVVYDQFFRSDNPQADIYYRRFSLSGEPLTEDIRVNDHQADWQIHPAVAATPDGGFVVVWTSQEQDGSYAGIFGRRFTREGEPLGQEFQVNEVTFSDQILSQIAVDAKGNFIVVWQSYDPVSFALAAWDIKARLFRADGTPVGSEVFVNKHVENYQELPLVDFAPNGTFVAVWHSNAQVAPFEVNLVDVFARRFSASPADEPCVVSAGRLACDTGRTGGELEVQHGFGGPGSGLPFLGDVDGDGREDPCVYTEGIFRCDTDHEGGAAEVLIPFAVPGAAVPLAGDVDGDSRADPCLFAAGAFHCDTKHDGGTAETRIVFGQKGETPLLGDLDGDGRDDACGFAGGFFRCDTAHDGGKPELLLRFGRRGDQPLLGDFDGDGRDDPCVFRKGTLLCDTAHDGGGAEGTLSLDGARDRVALGNLDGL